MGEIGNIRRHLKLRVPRRLDFGAAKFRQTQYRPLQPPPPLQTSGSCCAGAHSALPSPAPPTSPCPRRTSPGCVTCIHHSAPERAASYATPAVWESKTARASRSSVQRGGMSAGRKKFPGYGRFTTVRQSAMTRFMVPAAAPGGSHSASWKDRKAYVRPFGVLAMRPSASMSSTT